MVFGSVVNVSVVESGGLPGGRVEGMENSFGWGSSRPCKNYENAREGTFALHAPLESFKKALNSSTSAISSRISRAYGRDAKREYAPSRATGSSCTRLALGEHKGVTILWREMHFVVNL